MSGAPRPPRAAGWPFFAASPTAQIEAAMQLAEVEPGMRVCDLGCGDGALRLAAAGADAEVVVDDQLRDPLPGRLAQLRPNRR